MVMAFSILCHVPKFVERDSEPENRRFGQAASLREFFECDRGVAAMQSIEELERALDSINTRKSIIFSNCARLAFRILGQCRLRPNDNLTILSKGTFDSRLEYA